MRYRATTLLLCALYALSMTILCAQDFTPISPRIVSPRLMGFGGAYSALEAGTDTLSTNPAALAFTQPRWSFARTAANVSGPLFDLPSAFKADDVTYELLDLVQENNGIYIAAEATGPLAVSRVEKNVGFGFFNRTMLLTDVPSLTKATILVGEEVLLVGGYGLTVWEKGAHSLSVGLQLKGFFQVFVSESGTSITVINRLTDMSLDNMPTILSTGFGLDAGLLYRFNQRLSAALVCRDVYTPTFITQYPGLDDFIDGESGSETDYERLPIYMVTGVAWDIPLPQRWTTITEWKVMADYRDILAFTDAIYRNPVLNFAFGTEVTLLDTVSLRAGIADSYLCAGLGIDLTLCSIDLAMYGTELGIEPGERAVFNLAFSLSFEY